MTSQTCLHKVSREFSSGCNILFPEGPVINYRGQEVPMSNAEFNKYQCCMPLRCLGRRSLADVACKATLPQMTGGA